MDAFSVDDVGGLGFKDSAFFALDLSKAVYGPAQRIYHPSQVCIPHRDRKDLPGPFDGLPLFDPRKVAQNNSPYFLLVKVEGKALHPSFKLEQLV